jgi:hypothetical protein
VNEVEDGSPEQPAEEPRELTQAEADRMVLVEALGAARFKLSNAKANVYLHRAGLEEIGSLEDLLKACRLHEIAVGEFERLLEHGMPTPDATVIEIARALPDQDTPA